MLRHHELPPEHCPELVVFIDRDMRIADANVAAAEAYGYSREEIKGLPIDRICDTNLIPSPEPQEYDAPKPVMLETQHRTRSGATFPVEASLFSSDVGGRRVTIMLGRDIRPRDRRLRSEQLLHEIDRRILRSEPLDAVLAFACDELARVYELPLVQFSLRGDNGQVEIREWAGSGSEFLENIEVRYDDSPAGQGPTGSAIRTGEVQVRDLVSDPGFDRWRVRAVECGFRRAIAIPVAAHEEILGALTLFMKTERALDVETLNALITLTDQIAMSVVAARRNELLNLQSVALKSAANAVLVTDASGIIQWVNPAFCRLTGFPAEEAIGQKPSIMKSGNHADAFYRQMWQTLTDGFPWAGEIYNRRKDGTLYLEEQTITPVRGHDGRITHFVAIKQDITARKAQEEQIRHLAMHDPLTNLPNRRALDAAMRRAGRGGEGAALILDLDNFKLVNDTLGHIAGDQLLAEVGTVLHENLRPGDFLARFGGDEFAVLLRDADHGQSLEIAERLRMAINAHRFRYDGVQFDVASSIGMAPIVEGADAATILVRADSALYAAKARGKNRTVAWPFGEEEGQKLVAAKRWASRIKDALREDRLVLHYQPVVNINTGKATHYEALLRLCDGDGPPIPASEFISSAERFGLMPQIDRWVLERVLKVLAGPGRARIFINISGASLCDESLLDFIVERVRAAALPPGRLAFEITESAAVTDLLRAQEWVAKLKELGCLFALDDFGIGFSSFSYLRSLSADYVKIDRSFVADLDTNPTNRALVRAVKSVANTLGKEVIAEGVETGRLENALRELGVELAQGYLWGQAQSAPPEDEKFFPATADSNA